MATKKSSREGPNELPSTSSSFSNFSIDHILYKAGDNCTRKVVNTNENMYSRVRFTLDQFSWLQCTRYCPPKIPRNHRKDAPPRRQMGRHPRIPFTSQQLYILEEKFQKTAYLTGEEVMELACKLQLADVRVKIWFQNRRARDRREKYTVETVNATTETETNTISEIQRSEKGQSSLFEDFKFSFPISEISER